MKWITPIMAAIVATLASATAAAAAPAAPFIGAPIATAEQAGYAVTGAQFRYAAQSVYLRNPANVAASVGGYGYSVQLWSGALVVVLGASASTSPASSYSPALAVFDATTHALICSTAASGAQQCPGTPADWINGSVSYAAGDRITESLYYSAASGNLTATIRDATAGHSSAATFDAGTGVSFRQARLGAETGVDPWTGAPYTAPPGPVRLGAVTAATVTTYSGHRSGLVSWFQHTEVIQDPATHAQITPSSLTASGTAFTITLQP